MSPVDIAQAQLDAYNAQDLDAYCGFFTDDIVVADLNGNVTTKAGRLTANAMRAPSRSFRRTGPSC